MRKKRHNIQKQDNVIVFPGTINKLIADGHHFAEHYQYDLAVQALSEALQYTEGDESTLSVYAFSLYEIRNFEKAKEACEKLLAIGPHKYIEAMELYLTVCMELKEFNQVEELIRSLLEEKVIPEESIPKFIRLQELNARIAENLIQTDEPIVDMKIDNTELQLERFFSLSYMKQFQLLQSIRQVNIRHIKEEIVAIIEDERIHPLLQSEALLLLVNQQVDTTVTVTKFNVQCTVNPADLTEPTALPVTKVVMAVVEDDLQQEPSALDMVQYLIQRHIVVTYPFEWFDYEAREIADGYIDFVHAMFGEVKETDYDLMDFFHKLEQLSELPDV
ncbi:tetratricopeptide repeat protein [Viridibacillus sp. NPDC096237]|uniref:tetratricopeptide repeat protein n=1 Tax=Viridibacillus sp. NPDC096237 TaxID=3390721 RepID=UPI003CFFEF12